MASVAVKDVPGYGPAAIDVDAYAIAGELIAFDRNFGGAFDQDADPVACKGIAADLHVRCVEQMQCCSLRPTESVVGQPDVEGGVPNVHRP